MSLPAFARGVRFGKLDQILDRHGIAQDERILIEEFSEARRIRFDGFEECVDPSRVLTTAEAARLIERADGMFRIMLLVALRTGQRQGEQLALAWGDVDLDTQRLHVRRSVRAGVVGEPKTRHSARVIPLDATLVRELKRWKLPCPPTQGKLVFPSASGGYVPAAGCSRQLRALLARCGLERPELSAFRWHDLRHTFASHALAGGMTLIDVSRLFGHSTPSVTATVYAHSLPDRENERREQLGMLFAEKVKHK